MPQYATYLEFVNSAFGRDYAPSGDCAVFETSGQITELIEFISAQIDLYTGRTFSTGVVVEDFKASPKMSTYLFHFPVQAVNSIVFQPISQGAGYSVDPPITIDPTFYRFYNDGRLIFNARLQQGGIYTVEYVHGTLTVPASIKHATLLWMNIVSQSLSTNSMAIPDGGAVTSIQFDKVREAYVDPRTRYDNPDIDIPITVKAILDRYRLFQ